MIFFWTVLDRTTFVAWWGSVLLWWNMFNDTVRSQILTLKMKNFKYKKFTKHIKYEEKKATNIKKKMIKKIWLSIDLLIGHYHWPFTTNKLYIINKNVKDYTFNCPFSCSSYTIGNSESQIYLSLTIHFSSKKN